MRKPLTLSPVDALVIFQAERPWPAPRWWRIVRRLFPREFRHVLVLFYDPDGDAWCVLDPVYGGIQARALCARRLTLQALLAQYPATHWALVPRDRHLMPRIVRGPVTCVSVVKAVLGLGGRSWTPYQLWRQVTALPGVERGAVEGAPQAQASGGSQAA